MLKRICRCPLKGEGALGSESDLAGERLAWIARSKAAFVLTTGSDSEPCGGPPYTTNLPLEKALVPDVMLAHSADGESLSREHGGPVRMITPRLYAWKGSKWIEKIEFSALDRPGFWEQRGYSNSAEPWYEDRFSRRAAEQDG
jgi:DMSO/TMAO reductase YedYZ molybdopterin-dependent catalytic subunit